MLEPYIFFYNWIGINIQSLYLDCLHFLRNKKEQFSFTINLHLELCENVIKKNGCSLKRKKKMF